MPVSKATKDKQGSWHLLVPGFSAFWIAGLLACLMTGPAALGQCEVSMRESNYWFVAPEVDQSHGDQPLYMRITSYDDPVDIR